MTGSQKALPPLGTVQRIGVIGAGQMGGGIAQVAAVAGYDVRLVDVSIQQLENSRALMMKLLDRQISKGAFTDDEKSQSLARITFSTEYDALGDCELIVEAATENETTKHKIFENLLPRIKAEAIVATNTSSISITRLAAQTDRPERFIGMHFMNPVPVMKLVEIIRGIATQDDTYRAVVEVSEKLGKTSVTAEDFPAFIVNRILLPMINEAVYTLYEGVGNVVSIDTAMKLGANHPMGPLELADFIGLDTCLAIMGVLHEGLADSKYRPCPLLVKYVEAGWLGRKTQRGFYDYRGEKPVPTR